MRNLLTIVLAGGDGRRLRPLTERRAKPAVPFAGRRLVDFTLANCALSGIGRVVVLTQYLAEGVERHVHGTYSGRVQTWSAREAGHTFRGTADAVRALLARERRPRRLLVLASDHVYRMDYGALLATHAATRAEATLCVTPVAREEARHLGIVDADAAGRVREFLEKPYDPPEAPVASMGIYLFERDPLEDFLAVHPQAVDFGHDVVPALLAAGRPVAAHAFAGPWRDIADVDAYHRAHLQYRNRPSKSYVADSACVARSASLEESILLPGATVGRGARLRRAIVEEGVHVPAGAVIGYDAAEDAAYAHVTARGVTVVTTSRPAGHPVPA